jgi:hypothetical protein
MWWLVAFLSGVIVFSAVMHETFVDPDEGIVLKDLKDRKDFKDPKKSFKDEDVLYVDNSAYGQQILMID